MATDYSCLSQRVIFRNDKTIRSVVLSIICSSKSEHLIHSAFVQCETLSFEYSFTDDNAFVIFFFQKLINVFKHEYAFKDVVCDRDCQMHCIRITLKCVDHNDCSIAITVDV